METREKASKVFDEQITRAAAAVAKLWARGVPVVFVRPPSSGEYYVYEQRVFPRAETWDLLLKRTGAGGIHFDDYPQLQGDHLPEWSHIAASDANRFTAALVPLVQREFAASHQGEPPLRSLHEAPGKRNSIAQQVRDWMPARIRTSSPTWCAR